LFLLLGGIELAMAIRRPRYARRGGCARVGRPYCVGRERADTIAAPGASRGTMPATPDALPTDPADLQQYCRQLLADECPTELVTKFSHQLALFRHYRYRRRSEQIDPAQLLLR
jgi:hypothetical protein